MSRMKKLGEAGPGNTLARSRTLQLLTVFNQKAEVIAVIYAFSSVKEKCEGLQSGESLPVDEKNGGCF